MKWRLLLLLTTVTAAVGQSESSTNCGICERGSSSLTCPDSFEKEFELEIIKHSMQITCRSHITFINSTYLQGCEFPLITHIGFKYCPLPDVSFGSFLKGIGINSSNIVYFRFNNHWARDGLVLREDHFEDLDNLKYLEMHGNDFSYFPEDLLRNKRDLQTLNLLDNRITNLSESLFSNTPKLKFLDLQGNGLTSLPLNIFSNLKELTNMSLFDNKLSEVQSGIFGDLVNLLLIELSTNKLHVLPQDLFINNAKLRTVSLRKNKLENLPESLFSTNVDLVQIKLNRNILTTLPENIFKESKKVELLNMDKNKIDNLPSAVFQNMVELRNLSMKENQLESFSENLFSGLKNVLQINMGDNLLHSLPQQAFRSTHKLIDLHLNKNRLTELPSRIFDKCTSLTELYISNNNLNSLPIKLFPENTKLRLVDMSYNNLSSLSPPIGIPGFQSVTPFNDQFKVELLNFAANKLRNIPKDFQLLLLELKKISFRGNLIKQLIDIDFLSKHVVIDLRDNNIERYIIQPHLMQYHLINEQNNKTVKRKLDMYLSGNNLICDCSSYDFLRIIKNETTNAPFNINIKDIDGIQCSEPDYLENQNFINVNSEELLCDLASVYPGQNCTEPCQCFYRIHDKQHIMNCNNSGLTEVPDIPEPFINKSLTLNLANNSISSLAALYKLEYKTLTQLNVSANKLEHINSALLTKNLTVLDISKNQITNMSQVVIDRWNSTNIKVILRDNPFTCDCSLQPLYNFILEYNSEKVLDYGSVYCADPPEIENEIEEMEPLKILDMRTDQFCPYALPLEVMVTLSVVIVVIVSIAIIGTVFYYKNIEAIKVWLFAHRLCLCWITEEELDVDKKYDAFISYSHKDEEFVNQLLVPGLESGDPHYRVCLHYRDWVPGEYIQNQILSSVKASRRTVVVLSKNFIESVWGQMEFKAAHSQALQDNTNRIIVIVYGEVPPESTMDEELKMYISMKTYLKWGDAKFWERLRYAMPHPQSPITKKKNKHGNIDKIELCKANSDKTMV